MLQAERRNKEETLMKNTHTCPKCKGTEIVRVEGGFEPHDNRIMVGWSIFSAIPVHRYVCCDCGFSEEWLDKEDVQKLKEKYTK